MIRRPPSRRAEGSGNADSLTLNRARLVYLASGDGARPAPPLLFVHGWAAAKTIWRASLMHFAPRYRCYAPDLPGFGDSPSLDTDGGYMPGELAASVVGLARALDLPPAVWIGHSLGGMIALCAALDSPQAVAGLVLVNPAYFGQLPRSERVLIDGRLGDTLITGLSLANKILGLFAPPDGGGQIGAFLRRAQAGGLARRRALRESLLGAKRTDLRSRVAAIRMPALVVTGDRDRTTPPASARELAERIPGARLVEFSHVGHHPMDERPKQFLRVLDDWLATTF